MKKILFFFLFLIGIKAHAQYSSFDFIHVCGNPEKGKFLPMEQDSFRSEFPFLSDGVYQDIHEAISPPAAPPAPDSLRDFVSPPSADLFSLLNPVGGLREGFSQIESLSISPPSPATHRPPKRPLSPPSTVSSRTPAATAAPPAAPVPAGRKFFGSKPKPSKFFLN